MRVIALINQKGGVGKTTTALNLSHAMALSGLRVLSLDLDPQGHLSASFGQAPQTPGMDAVLLGESAIDERIIQVRERLHLIPAGPRLGLVDGLSEGGAQRGSLLKEALAGAGTEWDIVIADCPPSAGVLGMNAILAADDLIIPVSGDFLALHGLSRLMELLQRIEQRMRRDVRTWIVLTRFQDRRRHAQEVREKILHYFPGQVLATTVRESVALTESPSFAQTIFEYRPRHRSATEFKSLADDVLQGRVC